MKVYGGLMPDLPAVPESIRRLEDLGYDVVMTTEIAHDPFFPLLLAAEHSQRIGLITSVAIAFARNPMSLANVAHDLNSYSKGRFILGLGSQIKPHITRRMSMPWSKPAARMREFILAMRAIWDCWYQGQPLDFRGEFYKHTLMTPMFSPLDTEYGPPRVMLAGVGPRITRVAGDVADGFLAHSFTTARYMREVTLPALEQGLAASGRSGRTTRSCVPFSASRPRRSLRSGPRARRSASASPSMARLRPTAPFSSSTAGETFRASSRRSPSSRSGTRWARSSKTTCSRSSPSSPSRETSPRA